MLAGWAKDREIQAQAKHFSAGQSHKWFLLGSDTRLLLCMLQDDYITFFGCDLAEKLLQVGQIFLANLQVFYFVTPGVTKRALAGLHRGLVFSERETRVDGAGKSIHVIVGRQGPFELVCLPAKRWELIRLGP